MLKKKVEYKAYKSAVDCYLAAMNAHNSQNDENIETDKKIQSCEETQKEIVQTVNNPLNIEHLF